MGWLDHLLDDRGPRDPTPLPEAALAALPVVARPLHHAFAHRVLPQVMHTAPTQVLAQLTGPGALPSLHRLVHALCAPHPSQEPVDPDALRVTPFEGPDLLGVIVHLPPPRALTEAWFVALIQPVDRSGGIRARAAARVLTLEHSLTADRGIPHTVVGEWLADGGRRHHGRGPAPTSAVFVAWIQEALGA